jgi:hypothetical protein
LRILELFLGVERFFCGQSHFKEHFLKEHLSFLLHAPFTPFLFLTQPFNLEQTSFCFLTPTLPHALLLGHLELPQLQSVSLIDVPH